MCGAVKTKGKGYVNLMLDCPSQSPELLLVRFQKVNQD
jgi:hypothetical protein